MNDELRTRKPKQTIDVPTGKVEIGDANSILNSSAIGSCVVVCAYDSHEKMGAMAHVMLPGKSPSDDPAKKTKYAQDALGEMLKKIGHNIEICLVGGANVLQKPGDTTGKNNIDSIVEILRGKRLEIKAQSLGGITRRSVIFDVEKGNIFYTVGDGDTMLLWAAKHI